MTQLPHKFNVGDRVRIKTWEEMGGHPNGDRIRFGDSISFISSMRHLCNMEFTVREMYEHNNIVCYHSEEGIEKQGGGLFWLFTDNMLDAADPEYDFNISDADFESILGG